jgi:hypothetical protein
MYADIKEWKDGAALKLQKNLRDSAAAARMRMNEGFPPSRPTPAHSIEPGHPTQGSIAGKPTSQSQQTFNDSPNSAAVAAGGTTTAFNQSQPVDHMFLLLCINTGRSWVLEQIGITTLDIGNDQQLFDRIREEYYIIRKREAWYQKTVLLQILSSKLPWLSHILKTLDLTVPKALDFVKFRLVPVKTCCQPWHFVSPAFPPEPEVKVKKTYDYRPCPQDEFEITSLDHVLLHSLLEPGPHLDHYWLDMFPKKLQEILEYRTGSPNANIGWGIRIVDGPDWAVVLWLALAVMSFSGVLGVIYSIVKKDPGGGFTMAGFLVTLIFVGFAYLQAKTTM